MGTHVDNIAVITECQPDAAFALEVIEGLLKLLEGNTEAQVIKEVWHADAERWADTVRAVVAGESPATATAITDIFAGFNLGFVPQL